MKCDSKNCPGCPECWQPEQHKKISNDLAKEIVAFVLWLTPCGQDNPPPRPADIGRQARALLVKMIRENV